MAVPSYINATALGSSGNVGPTTGIDTTGATALRVVVITQQSATPTVSDSRTNTWAVDRAAVLLSSGFTGWVHFLKATTNNVGTSHTFSATGTSACSIWAIAVSPSAGGSLTLTAFDAIATASSPYTSNSVTPATADALLIAFGASDGAGSPVATDWSGSSFTGRAEVTDHNNFWGGSIATRAVTSSAAYTASFTDNSSGPTNSVVAILAVTESGGGTAVGQVTETDTALSISPAGPAISGTSTSSPVYRSQLTITGTSFGASQGTKEVRIGGTVQPVSSWSATSITVSSVDRGASKYGAAVNVEIWDSGALISNSFALTGLQPQAGWSYIDLTTPNATAANRITTTPDLASGDQVACDNRGGQVSVSADATFSAGSSVPSFEFEVWSSPDGWGAAATQYLLGAELSSRALYAARLVDTARRRRVSSYALSPGNWGTTPLGVEKWFAPELTAPVGGGSTIAVGLVTETDTAQPITARHVRQVAQVAETDSAQPITARLARGVAQVSEADTAQPMVARLVRAVAQVSEADTAQPITLGGTAVAVGQVVETDTAQPITGRLLRAVGQVLETDTAQPIGGNSGVLVAQAVETDTAQSISARYIRAVGQVLETDSAQALIARHIRTVQQVVETDTAQAILLSVPGVIGMATETDSAQPVVARLIRAIGIVTETDTAQAVTLGSAGGIVGQAQEEDTAQTITARLRSAVGQVLESDSALQMRVAIGRAVAQAIETDQALAMAQRQLLQIGIVTEIDTALLITYPGYGDELSEAFRYDVPGASLRYDIPAASLRFDVPSIGSAITIT